MKLKLILAVLALLTIAPINAQSLIEKTAGQRNAEQIDQKQTQLINFLESELRTMYQLASQDGNQQATLDALGTNAVAALQRYQLFRSALLQVKPDANVPAPNPEIFVANKDGTVTYVAPPEPEPPAPTPAPEP